MPTNLRAAVGTLIEKGTPTPSKVTSPARLRAAKLPFSQSLATDIEALSSGLNTLHTVMASNAPALTQLVLTNQQGQVVAAFGDFVYQGSYYTNFLNEIHVGDPLLKGNPQDALFNANTDGSVTIGQNGWLDVLDPFGGSAAWLGTQNDTLAVTGAANNGSGLIRLTVPGHTLTTGNRVRVQKVGGVGQPPPGNGTFVNNSTGLWTVTVVDSSHIDLQASVFAGAYTSGGMVDRVLRVTGAANNGSGSIRITTAATHTYATGDQAAIASVGGVPNANGQWVVKVIDSTHFDLTGSTFAGAYTSGGTCLRYFAGMLAETIAIGPSFANYKLRAFADGSLKIANATITLSSANGTIILDPAQPQITLSDQSGNPVVTLEVLQEAAISITATTHGSPDVITAPGNAYINGDTVFITGAAGDTNINGYRIITGLSGPGGTFKLTTLAGAPVNGNAAYTGGGTVARYYAGALMQTLALGTSFSNFTLRAFADGTLQIKGAVIATSTLTGASIDSTSTINGSTINNGILNSPTLSGTVTGGGNLTESTSAVLTITGGTGSVLGTGVAIQVKQASASQDGYLSAADWTHFNSGGVTTGNLTEATSAVLTITGGTGAVVGVGTTIQVKQAATAQNGFLSSTDWNTFNGKQAALTIGNLTEATSSVLTITGGTGAIIGSGLTVQVKQAATAQNGYLSSADWNTFNGKQGALTIGNLTEATSAVLTITGGTGAVIGSGLSIQVKQATTSQSGYLSSTDWNTFNGKQATLALGNLTETTSSVLTVTGGTGAIVGSGLTIQVKQAATAQSGYLSSTDWNTFNGKQAALTLPLSIANGGSGQTTAAAALSALGGASLTANNVFTASGSVLFLGRPANFATNGVNWSINISNSGSSDSIGLAQSGTTYTTGGVLGWVGNSMAFLYYPNPEFRIGTGTGATPVMVFKGNGHVLIGTVTDNGQQFQVAGTSAFTGTATFTVAPVFTDQSGTRTALGLTGAATATLPLSIANGGSGQITAAAALSAFGGASLTGNNTFTGAQTINNSAFPSVLMTTTATGTSAYNAIRLNAGDGGTSFCYLAIGGLNVANTGLRGNAYFYAENGASLLLGTQDITALSIDTSQNVTLLNPLAIGSGGTGKTTAAAAFAALASTSATTGIGSVKLGYKNAINSGSQLEWWAGDTVTLTGAITHQLLTISALNQGVFFLKVWNGTSGLIEAMRILGTGNVLVGTTTDGGQNFQVGGTSLFTGATTLSGAVTHASTTALNGVTTLGAGMNLNGQTISGAATFSGVITHSGNMSAGGVAPRQQLSVGASLDIYSGAPNSPTQSSIRGAGNLVVNGGPAGGGVLFNFDSGTGGVLFYDGAAGNVAAISSAGLITCPSLNVTNAANITLGSNWVSFTPTLTGGGAMTVSGVTITDAQYCRFGPLVFIKIYFSAFTTGGTSNPAMTVGNLPLALVGNVSSISAINNAVPFGALYAFVNGTTISLTTQGGWALGPSQSILISGFYRVA